jgi:predicted lipid-binding transport protein (Tim44 family)
MGNGFQFIDIIFFAMIAAFLVLRLRSVLGRRNDTKTGHRDPFAKAERAKEDNVVPLPDLAREPAVDTGRRTDPSRTDAPASESASLVDQGVQQISRLDSDFNPKEFLIGARAAFEMILNAFAAGDKATLKGMLSAEVYGNFVRAIDDRQKAGHTLEDTLVGIKSAEVVEAFLEGRVGHVTVKFVSEQITVTRDSDGQIVDGNPNTVTEVTDFWTFARDTRSRDPNWDLVATRSLD